MRQESGKEAWRNALTEAAKQSSASCVLNVLLHELTSLTGISGQALKRGAVQIIESAVSFDSPKLLRIAESLSAAGSELGEELAVFLLPAHYAASPVRASDQLKRLVRSPYTAVRNWAADACGAVLSKHFQTFYPELVQWLNDESPFVRGAVVIAVKYASNIKNPAWGAPLLNLMEPLLRDKDPIVKKTLGARIWTDGLLRNYTDELAVRQHHWARSDDPAVRWHAAKIFASPEAALHLENLGPSLQILLTDPSAAVQKSAISALRQLSKRMQDPSPLLKLGAV